MPDTTRTGIIMTHKQNPELITYVDSNRADWQEFRPGSRRKVLYEDSGTGQLTMLVQWESGYRMGVVERHEYDEHLYILAGTFVDEQRASGPGTYILNRPARSTKPTRPMDALFSKSCLDGRRDTASVHVSTKARGPTQISAAISDQQRHRAWSQGTVSDWVMESFAVARRDAYGLLPEPSGRGVYALDAGYINAAVQDVRIQLSRAGVRLSVRLNRTLGTP